MLQGLTVFRLANTKPLSCLASPFLSKTSSGSRFVCFCPLTRPGLPRWALCDVPVSSFRDLWSVNLPLCVSYYHF